MSHRLAHQIELACRIEATARKPGNVHPEASFPDLTYADFVASAVAASRPLSRAEELGVGATIEAAIQATRAVVSTNTNLGIALLIAPLAAVTSLRSLTEGIADVLQQLTLDDAAAVYRAIRLAVPGGLGRSSSEDVADEPTQSLRDVMRLAADRDRIARQYVTDFADVLGFGRDRLAHWRRVGAGDWELGVIGLHLSLLAEFPDSLIERKCGVAVALEASQRAGEVLAAGWPEARGQAEIVRLDQWLRGDGHRRNPGTTADLVAATLFADLRDREFDPDPQLPVEEQARRFFSGASQRL